MNTSRSCGHFNGLASCRPTERNLRRVARLRHEHCTERYYGELARVLFV